MHVLQVNIEKGWRGGERQTLLSMEGLRQTGLETSLLCLRHRPLWQRAREAGFPLVGVDGQVGALGHLMRSDRRYSLVHAQSARSFGVATLGGLVTRTPVVYTRRVDFVPRGMSTRWKYRQAAALVAISHAIRRILRTSGMGESTVISDILYEHEPDLNRGAQLKKRLGLEGRQIVGVVAALVDHKDPLTMVQAAEAVCQQLPDTVFLHFGEGHLRPRVEQEAERLGLNSSYRLMGHLQGVEDFFPHFDCFAMSSSEEGLGSSVLDAFFTRVPVATTDAGGLPELVRGRGLLSGAGSPAELAGNIVRLLTERPLAERFVEAARSYVLQHHRCTRITGQYVALYEKVLRAPSRF